MCAAGRESKASLSIVGTNWGHRWKPSYIMAIWYREFYRRASIEKAWFSWVGDEKKNQFIGRQIIVRSVPHEFSCSCAAPREHQCQRLFLHVFHTFCVVFCMFFTCSAIFLHVFHMVCERCHPRRHCNLFSVWSVANLKISTVMGHPKFRRSLLSEYPKRESQTTMTSITAIFKVGYWIGPPRMTPSWENIRFLARPVWQ